MDDIQKRIAAKKGTDVNTFEVRQLIGEYDFVAKKLYQVKDAKALMLDLAKGYQEDEALAKGVDLVYGEGAADYIGKAIEAFYS